MIITNIAYFTFDSVIQYSVFIPFIYFDLKSFIASSSTLSILRSINILIVYSPLFAIVLVYFFSIEPIGIVGNRLFYFTPKNIEIALIIILQQGVTLGSFAYYNLNHTRRVTQSSWNDYKFVVWSIVHITVAFLCNQSGTIISGGYGSDHFKAEGTWGGWALVFILTSSLGFLQIFKKGNKKIIWTMIFSISIFLISGNRGEVLIHCLIICYLIARDRRDFFSGENKFNILQVLKIAVLATLVFLAFEFIGMLRVTGIEDSKNRGEMSLMVGTLGSYSYSVISMIGIANDIGLKYGVTFLSYFQNSIPSFIPVPWERADDISKITDIATTRGGSGFAGEAYLNFGIFGPSLIACLYLLFLIRLYKRSFSSDLSLYFFIAFTLYLPRLTYYGYVYTYKLILVYLVVHLMMKVIKLCRY